MNLQSLLNPNPAEAKLHATIACQPKEKVLTDEVQLKNKSPKCYWPKERDSAKPQVSLGSAHIVYYNIARAVMHAAVSFEAGGGKR